MKLLTDRKNKILPELYDLRENCCGCAACYSVCPMSAITMEPDEEGFDYPVIDSAKCIRCYNCLSVCPIRLAIEGGSIDDLHKEYHL